jgi:hypothetical protein
VSFIRELAHKNPSVEKFPFRLLRFAHGERECRYGLPIVRPHSKYGTHARLLDRLAITCCGGTR